MPGKGRAARLLRRPWNNSALLPGWRATRTNNVLAVANQAAANGLQGLDQATLNWAGRNMIYNSMAQYRQFAARNVRSRRYNRGHIPGSSSWAPSQIANHVLGPVARRLRERLAAIRARRSVRGYHALLEHRLTGRNRYFTPGPNYRKHGR